MTMAKVMYLTFRNVDKTQPNLFQVYRPGTDKRISCSTLLNDSLNVEQWLVQSKLQI